MRPVRRGSFRNLPQAPQIADALQNGEGRVQRQVSFDDSDNRDGPARPVRI